jgi:gas vesicle protein
MVDWFPAAQSDFWLVMSQRDGFSSGFLLGTIVGGLIGGIAGTLLVAKQLADTSEDDDAGDTANSLTTKSAKRKNFFKAAASKHPDMESARRSLEDKIAQLNEAIDDVREQLGGVNSSVLGDNHESSALKEPHGQG